MTTTTIKDLWKGVSNETSWSELKIDRELDNIELRAVRPRIPEDHLIFRIFKAFQKPENQIKVVILGQDPYPEILSVPGGGGDDDGDDTDVLTSRACGFSFSSPLGSLPLSLRTIIGEILREYKQPLIERGGKKAPRPAVPSDYSGDLSYLVKNGVFLLNTYLTCHFDGKHGVGLSHPSWVTFTTQVLNFIRRKCPHVVYLALGKKASDLLKASCIQDALECDHPANRFGGRNPFNGSNIFIQANELLEKRGVAKVDWVPMKKAVDVTYYVPCVDCIQADLIVVPPVKVVVPATATAPAKPEDEETEEDEDDDEVV